MPGRSADCQHILHSLTFWAERCLCGFADGDDSHDVFLFRDGEEFADSIGIADAHDEGRISKLGRF